MSTENDGIKVEKLINGDQWNIWKFQIKIILSSSDLLKYVIGEELKPVLSAEPKPDELQKMRIWVLADSKAQRVIATSIGPQPLLHIMNCKTSKEMWDKLQSVYELKSKTSIHMLQQQFYSFTKDPQDDIALHISKLQTIVQQLADVGESVSSSMVVTKILMTLPPSYSHFYSAWESTSSDQQTLDNLITRLVMEEARINSQNGQSELEGSNALIASKQYEPRKSLHKSKQATKLGKCFICKSSGHWKKDCPKRKDKVEHTNSNRKRGNAFVCEVLLADGVSRSGDWFLDSGASDHMTSHKEWFINYKEFKQPIIVRLGNGNTINAYGRGDINVLSYNNVSWEENHLADVLYVPDIRLNLFSLNCALDKGLTLCSDSSKCQLYKGNTVLVVGERQAKLFKLLMKVTNGSEVNAYANFAEGKKVTLRKWHEKLGHQNIAHVKSILKARNILFDDIENFFCEACMYGKQHRAVFHHSENKATCVGELVHSDVCGPMQNTSIGGSKYFLLFKDDFSHFRKVFFLKEKSEVQTLMEKYLKMVEAETGAKVKILRTDNGLEYTNQHVQNILSQHCVIHQKTVPYTPEQNGCAEREMRTIVEAARAMIHGRNLDLKFWAEAVNTAVFVLNRTGTSPVKGKTPYELWFGHSPEIDNFQVFGSDIFVHVPQQKRRKWDRKSKKGIFVGYADHVKGYRAYIPDSNKIEICRDVIFHDEEDVIKSNYKDVLVPILTSAADSESSLPIYDGESAKVMDGKENDGFADSGGAYGGSSSDADLEDVFEEAVEIGDEAGMEKQQENDNIKNRLRSKTKIIQSDANCCIEESFAFLAQSFTPVSFEEAIQCDDSRKWKIAMDEEIHSLKKNNTWTLMHLPKNRKLVDTKWVYQIKNSTENEGERFKARLVARGFSQQFGIDYFETFSPVAKFSSIRTILCIAASQNLHIRQFDVKTAFLYGNIQEEIYVRQPKGYDDRTGRVCLLQKSLYGLKQASRCWNQTFTKLLKDFHFRPCDADPCVFISQRNENKIILAIYIDDGLVASTNAEEISKLCSYLKRNFEIKIFPAKHFLGLEIRKLLDGSIHVNQSQYVKRLISKFNMEDAVPVSTPADTYFSQISGSELSAEKTNFPFRQAVGSLMYLMVATRPDVAFAVGCVSRYLDNPSHLHVIMVKRILRYIKGTPDYGILFKNAKFTLSCFSDADYAGDVVTRRSTSGYVFLMGSSCITWASQRQKCVALSTTEAEFVAACQAVKELVWIQQLLRDLLKNQSVVPTLYVDNQGAIRLIKNPEFHKRTKHIDVRFNFIREKFEEKLFELEYVSSHNQIGDIFTKALPKDKFVRFRSMMGVMPLNL